MLFNETQEQKGARQLLRRAASGAPSGAVGSRVRGAQGQVAVALLPAVCFALLIRLARGLKNVRLCLFLAFKCVKETHNFIILFLSS